MGKPGVKTRASFLVGREVTNGNESCQHGFDEKVGLLADFQFAEGGPLNIATLKEEPSKRVTGALERAVMCARVAEDNKAQNVVILDLRGITPLYDFFVLASGTSRRQIHTLAEEIDAAMKAEGESRLSIEGYQASKWVVQDYGDIVVHVFDPETRSYYALEELWADASHVDWKTVL
jgi:ribosome-associated protein